MFHLGTFPVEKHLSVRFVSSNTSGPLVLFRKRATQIPFRISYKLELFRSCDLIHLFFGFYNLDFFHLPYVRNSIEVHYEASKITFHTGEKLSVG